MSSMLRKMRIAFSIVCGIICLLLIVLWVRSNTTRDSVFWPWTNHALHVNSLKGHVVICLLGKGHSAQWVPFKIQHVTIGESFKTDFDRNVLGFYVERKPNELRLDIPYWFFVITCLMIAASLWLHDKWRFSLRALLVATTLVAVLLGAIVYAIR
jgi:hypothetical protein